MSESRTFPLYPYQTAMVEELKRAYADGVPIVLNTGRLPGRATAMRAAAEAIAHMKPEAQAQVVAAMPLGALDDKGREAQRLQADFDRMFGKKP